MNKKLILSLITIMCIFYLLLSFAVWNINAAHWNPVLRFVYAYFCILLNVIAYFILLNNKN
jgi:hypothetical protein